MDHHENGASTIKSSIILHGRFTNNNENFNFDDAVAITSRYLQASFAPCESYYAVVEILFSNLELLPTDKKASNI